MNSCSLVVVVRGLVGEDAAWRVVLIPRGEPDTTLVEEYSATLPDGWKDFGLYSSRDRAVEVARWVDMAMASPMVGEA